ncbi:MAG: hypothetical protein J6U47_05660, partial [Bacteroidales bacterium]|nr:hypothetical protein [Bacteroidales bacterium]
TQPNPEDILLVKKEQNNECLTPEEKERLDSETRDDITTMEDVMLDAPSRIDNAQMDELFLVSTAKTEE